MIKTFLGLFKRGQILNANLKNRVTGNSNLSDMDMSPSDADMKAQAKAAAMAAENEGLPSVNRRMGGNRVITILGFVFILCLGTALIVAVNSDQKNKRAKDMKKQETEQVSNRLPPINIPPPRPVEVVPAQVASPVPLISGSPQSVKSAKDGTKTSMEWSDRKLSGNLLVEIKSGTETGASVHYAPAEQGLPGRTDLGAKLDATVTVSRSAVMLKDRNFLITKGTSLDCALETAMDSSVPGLTTCRLTRDVYSDNGHVLLLDRGSQLVGEYHGGIKQGQVRLFVLWTRAKTPNGIIISLDSPGTDALGRPGHDGWVDNHFWERFGAAILMSLIKDGITVLAQNSGSGNNNTNIYSNSGTDAEKIIEKMLDSTVNIPPTIIKNQGEHIQIMVARDLDFSTVYGLKVLR